MSDTLFENYSEAPASTFDFTGAASWDGQVFTPSVTHDITSVKLFVYRRGTPGDMTVEIRETSAGLPTSTILTSETVSTSGITTSTSGEWIEIVFATSVELTASVQYAIVLAVPGGSPNTISIPWLQGANVIGYSGGTLVDSGDSGSTWSSSSDRDRWFEEYGISSVPANPVYVTGTIDAVSTVSGAVGVGIAVNIAGTIAALSTVAGAIEIIDTSLLSGTISALSTIAGVPTYISQDLFSWPNGRRTDYNEDKVWDEETKLWYIPTTPTGSLRLAQAGGRYRNQLVTLSDQGRIYFTEF